ncbi:MAG: phospholipase D-like domain-containing protein [Longimicrobiales bacterium]
MSPLPLRSIAKVLLALVLIALALLGILFLTRGTPLATVTGVGEPAGVAPVGSPDFRRLIELYTGTSIEPGHEIRVLQDGGMFPLMFAEMRTARRTLTVQIYYADPGRVATSLREVLEDRAAAGVRVLFLYDAFGSTLGEAYLDSLRAVGVTVAQFRPVKWYSLHKAQQRAHTRAVVIDGRIGYTGGFGIADMWWGGNEDWPREWRDTNVRFTGPAVAQLQGAFGISWVEATGQLLTGELFYPDGAEPGATDGADAGARAGVVYSAPAIGSTVAERMLALSIAGASRRLYIANAYYAPDDDFRRLLIAAAERGVDVRILVPGPRTDIPVVRRAGRATYQPLLEAGVRIYEYLPTMMHSKVLTADGVWSLIGSMNFDNRSLALNEETVLAIDDAGTARILEQRILSGIAQADEITLTEHSERPWHAKLVERAALLLARVL